MKILLDENVDVEFALLLPGHEVRHVSDQGWRAYTNGLLLRLAQIERFEVLITADKNMQYQQRIKGRLISLIVLDIHPNNFANLAACVENVREKLDVCEPGQVYVVEGPHPKRDKR